MNLSNMPPEVRAFRRCAKCGLAENEHDVRHPFVAARMGGVSS